MLTSRHNVVWHVVHPSDAQFCLFVAHGRSDHISLVFSPRFFSARLIFALFCLKIEINWSFFKPFFNRVKKSKASVQFWTINAFSWFQPNRRHCFGEIDISKKPILIKNYQRIRTFRATMSERAWSLILSQIPMQVEKKPAVSNIF